VDDDLAEPDRPGVVLGDVAEHDLRALAAQLELELLHRAGR
jgi:hypothetical protein